MPKIKPTEVEISEEQFLKMVQDYFSETGDEDFVDAFIDVKLNYHKLPEYWKTCLDQKLGVNRIIDVRYLLTKK